MSKCCYCEREFGRHEIPEIFITKAWWSGEMELHEFCHACASHRVGWKWRLSSWLIFKKYNRLATMLLMLWDKSGIREQ